MSWLLLYLCDSDLTGNPTHSTWAMVNLGSWLRVFQSRKTGMEWWGCVVKAVHINEDCETGEEAGVRVGYPFKGYLLVA